MSLGPIYSEFTKVSGRFLRDPIFLLTAIGLYAGAALLMFQGANLDTLISPTIVGALITGISLALFLSRYLGIFGDERVQPRSSASISDEMNLRDLVREVRNYLVHTKPNSSSNSQVNIDDEFKGQLLAKLTTESQAALASFIRGEAFRNAAEIDQKETNKSQLTSDIDLMIQTYQIDMNSWRKNANVNLMIGLICAIGGIAVMWQTLVTITFELDAGISWRITDLYRFIARFGLVVIIESVAFFFLKLYREDRSMIRYFRNEITNMESKCLSLKAAISFGQGTDITKVLQALSNTERNFLVKKGERVMSDLNYENTEIMIEKLIARFPELLKKQKNIEATS